MQISAKKLELAAQAAALSVITETEIDGRQVEALSVIHDDVDLLDLVLASELREIIEPLLECLTPHQRRLVFQIYGLDGVPERSKADLGRIHGGSRNSVYNNETKALLKMRQRAQQLGIKKGDF